MYGVEQWMTRLLALQIIHERQFNPVQGTLLWKNCDPLYWPLVTAPEGRILMENAPVIGSEEVVRSFAAVGVPGVEHDWWRKVRNFEKMLISDGMQKGVLCRTCVIGLWALEM